MHCFFQNYDVRCLPLTWFINKIKYYVGGLKQDWVDNQRWWNCTFICRVCVHHTRKNGHYFLSIINNRVLKYLTLLFSPQFRLVNSFDVNKLDNVIMYISQLNWQHRWSACVMEIRFVIRLQGLIWEIKKEVPENEMNRALGHLCAHIG